MGTKTEYEILEAYNYRCAYCDRLMAVYTSLSALAFSKKHDPASYNGRRVRSPIVGGRWRVCFGYTIDHVIPVCKGGTDDDSNLVPCCKQCNMRKATRTLAEWLAVETAPGRRERLAARRVYAQKYKLRRARRDLACETATAQDLESLLRLSLR